MFLFYNVYFDPFLGESQRKREGEMIVNPVGTISKVFISIFKCISKI